jgi:HicB_like antitoxin of bacterial toxin-antitoxin system
MERYIGIIDGSNDVWGVRFPDIDGCVGAGATPGDAILDATAALHDVLIYKTASGYALPHASTLSEVLTSGAVAEGEAIVIVPRP